MGHVSTAAIDTIAVALAALRSSVVELDGWATRRELDRGEALALIEANANYRARLADLRAAVAAVGIAYPLATMPVSATVSAGNTGGGRPGGGAGVTATTSRPTTEAPTLQHGECRSCKAPIVWVVTPAGQRMPLDRQPIRWLHEHASGGDSVHVGVCDDGRTIRGRVVPERTPGAHATRTSHFATCPNGNAHRQRPRVRHG